MTIATSPFNEKNHTTMRTWRSIGIGTALALLLAVSATACGSSDDNPSASSSTVAETTTITEGPETSDEDDTNGETLRIENVWARPGMADGNTAIYMVVYGGSDDERLVEVSADNDFAEAIEIHEVVVVEDDGATDDMDNHMGSAGSMNSDTEDDAGTDHGSMSGGMKMMRQIDGLDIPAGSQVTLEPGGYHVMVLGLKQALAVGDTVKVTLHFESTGEVEVTAEVREM